MSIILHRLIRDRKIIPSKTSLGMVLKEMEGGKSDLSEAKESLKSGRHKWAIVQAYYSAFHSARALLYAKSFREKSHRGLLAALRELYEREIPPSMLDAFEETMNMREAADYGLTYSEEGAINAVKVAEEFVNKTRSVLRTRQRSSSGQRDMLPYLGTLKPSSTSKLPPRQRKKSTRTKT
ncbi:HEPN domain-containing protein [Candidatus Bathyarchaeota archaeon]|nr:HEPN domain-containing protein [Candidatus Bathyarchaeota archaeon]